MKQSDFYILENKQIAKDIMQMKLYGDTSDVTNPGQFINIKINNFYLRRPISVCDKNNETLTIIYKIQGDGTSVLQKAEKGEKLNILTGLGNGYCLEKSGENPLLIGGGVGVPPMFWLAKKLIAENKSVTAILGFNSKDDVFYEDEFKNLGVKTIVTTVDGSYQLKGFVTDAMNELSYSYFYTCGPEPMLRAIYKSSKASGEFSFERRMGCGFGACMGCSCKTITGNKRICKEGPVIKKEDIIWED